jgi:hypothetical protein
VLHGPAANAAPTAVHEQAALSASFPLVPARPLDNALIVLTGSAEDARDGAKASFREDLAQPASRSERVCSAPPAVSRGQSLGHVRKGR